MQMNSKKNIITLPTPSRLQAIKKNKSKTRQKKHKKENIPEELI